MAKCPNCTLITAHDDGDPEVEDPSDTTGDESPTCDVRRVRVCADCNEELKEATFTIEPDTPTFTPKEVPDPLASDVEDYDPNHCPAQDPLDPEDPSTRPPCEFRWEAEAENTERVQTTDRHGKPIKRARYQTRYFGVEVTFTGECEHCKATAEAHGSDEVPASGMEELV